MGPGLQNRSSNVQCSAAVFIHLQQRHHGHLSTPETCRRETSLENQKRVRLLAHGDDRSAGARASVVLSSLASKLKSERRRLSTGRVLVHQRLGHDIQSLSGSPSKRDVRRDHCTQHLFGVQLVPVRNLSTPGRTKETRNTGAAVTQEATASTTCKTSHTVYSTNARTACIFFPPLSLFHCFSLSLSLYMCLSGKV